MIRKWNLVWALPPQSWLEEEPLQKAVRKTLLETWSSLKASHCSLEMGLSAASLTRIAELPLIKPTCDLVCDRRPALLSVTVCTYCELLHLDKLYPSPDLNHSLSSSLLLESGGLRSHHCCTGIPALGRISEGQSSWVHRLMWRHLILEGLTEKQPESRFYVHINKGNRRRNSTILWNGVRSQF